MNYRRDITAAYYDCDINNRLKLSAVLRYMQQAFAEHCADLGQSPEKLYDEGQVFLLVKTNLKIERMPFCREELSVVTAAAGVKGPRFVREFALETRDGERLISAYSMLALADVKSHRIVRPSAYPHDIPHGSAGIDGWVEDIPIPGGERVPKDADRAYSELTVRYSHLDINRHVNNSFYADMVCDVLPVEIMRERSAKTLALRFQREAKAGDTIEIEAARISSDSWIVSGAHERGRCFESLIELS